MLEALTQVPLKDSSIAWTMKFGSVTLSMVVDDGTDSTLQIRPAAIEAKEVLSQEADVTLKDTRNDWFKFAELEPVVGCQALSLMAESGPLKIELTDALRHGDRFRTAIWVTSAMHAESKFGDEITANSPMR